MSEPERTLRGVLLSEGRRCSSEGCRCRRGELHGRTIYGPAAAQAVCEAHVAVTGRNEALLLEVSQINLELLRRRALE